MSEEKKALVPIEQRDVDFYGDEIYVVLANVDGRETVYVPIRPICDYLGIDWSSQRQRINRDPILSEELIPCVVVSTTQGQPDQRRDMLCLPLEFVNGWLFGINANRVREEIRDNLLRYQRECYRILADAFLPSTTTAVTPIDAKDEVLSQLHNMALVIAATTREMMETRQMAQTNTQRLDRAAQVVGELSRRITSVEQKVQAGKLTEEQAAEIKKRVNLIAQEMAKHEPGKSHYQSIYAALGDETGTTSYKNIPPKAYETAVIWLDTWLQSVKSED
jgi:hypothetical protein